MNDDVKTQTANRPRVHLVRWIVASVVLLLAAFVVWQKVAPKPRTRAAAPQIVTVAQATLGDMPVILNELGTVTPTATVTVMPNQAVSGYLTEVPFQEGQDVEKGQVLAQIDPRPYQAALDQAIGTLQRDQGILHEAQMDLDRFQKLVKLDSIARQQAEDQAYVVVQNEGTVKLDQAAVDTAKLNLAYSRITAPVAGRVGLRLVDPGNYISGSSSTGVAVVTTIKPTTVVFTVAQNDLRQVVERFRTPGVKLPVTAYSSDGSKKLATGTLYAINNQMAASTGTVTLARELCQRRRSPVPQRIRQRPAARRYAAPGRAGAERGRAERRAGQLRLPREQGRYGVGAQGHAGAERRQEHRHRERPRGGRHRRHRRHGPVERRREDQGRPAPGTGTGAGAADLPDTGDRRHRQRRRRTAAFHRRKIPRRRSGR